MPNSDNADHQPTTSASCAWCGADIEGRAKADGTEPATDTMCPRCEADFESLSKSSESPRMERKRQSSSGDTAMSAWLIRRRRGWSTAWLILLTHLPLVV
jgi:hypothetical protein